jgi:hypothetical protein
MANLAGFVNHRPFVKAMASEKRSPVCRVRETLSEPLNDGSPFLWQGLDRYSRARDDVARDAEVELRLIPSQGEAKAWMPPPQKRGAIRIVFEKKIIHRMFHPRRCTLQSRRYPRLDPPLMSRAENNPLRWQKRLHKPRGR